MFVLRTQHTYINRLRAGRLKYRLSLLNFYFRGNTSLETALVQFQGLLVLFDRSVQELFLSVQAAGFEIINRQIGVHTEIYRSQVCRAGLRLLSVGLHSFSNSSPDVSLVGDVERKYEIVVRDTIEDLSHRRQAARCSQKSYRLRNRHSLQLYILVVTMA